MLPLRIVHAVSWLSAEPHDVLGDSDTGRLELLLNVEGRVVRRRG